MPGPLFFSYPSIRSPQLRAILLPSITASMLAQQPSAHVKTAIAVFAIVGIATFVFGMISIVSDISSPFARKQGYSFVSLDEAEKQRNDQLRADDTDSDGLSDYDELYVFRTSPFLADSDSDGDNDGLEVTTNHDPNCPKGKACIVERPVVTGEAQVGAATVVPTGPASTASGAPATGNDAAILAAVTKAFGDLSQMTPEALTAKVDTMPLADLKEFLTAIGIPKDLIDRANEATLRTLVKDTLAQSLAAAAATPPASPTR
jgi:hypothetical protein